MQAIQELSDKLASINIDKMLERLLGTSKYQAFVPDMVKERLYEQGIYSTGKQIVTYGATSGNVYSSWTIPFKQEKNQPYDRVTLRDSGAFYSSFSLKPKTTFAVIEYDENKGDGKISDNVDLDNVFNLSEGELKALRIELIPDIVTSIKTILRA